MEGQLFLVFLHDGMDSLPDGEAKSFLLSSACYRLSDNSIIARLGTDFDGTEFLIGLLSLSGQFPNSKLGAVLKLQGSYGGYFHGSFWEWLKETEETSVPV